MATRAAHGRGDAPKTELLGRVRVWKRQLLPVHTKDSALSTWQWVQTGRSLARASTSWLMALQIVATAQRQRSIDANLIRTPRSCASCAAWSSALLQTCIAPSVNSSDGAMDGHTARGCLRQSCCVKALQAARATRLATCRRNSPYAGGALGQEAETRTDP